MAKSSKKKTKKKDKPSGGKSGTNRPLLDNDSSAALDVTGEALEMIGRIAGEAAGRLRALAEVHRRRTATDDSE